MHAIWKGVISFGLVNIPVQLFSASHEKEISFVLLHKKDLSQIRYARMCKNEEKEVPWNEIVKGYEFQKGEYVVFDEKDFEKAHIKKTKSIEILQFLEEDAIDTIYYAKPYFLEPDKNGEKAYGLLRDALKKTKKMGLAQFVLRNKEHIAVIKVHNNMLIINELRYENEITPAIDIKIPSSIKNNKELDMAIQLIDQLTGTFQPKQYKDTYSEEIKKIVKRKAKGQPVHIESKEKISPSKVHDIMSLLEASLEQKKKPRKKSNKTKSA
jgi:DNA end-binding protein Ku